MALAAGQFRTGGKVVDQAGHGCVNSVAGDSALRATDYRSGGRVWNADGMEVVTPAGTPSRGGGITVDKTGHRCVVVEAGAPAATNYRSGGKMVSATGLDVLVATPGTGEYRSGGRVFDSVGREAVVVV